MAFEMLTDEQKKKLYDEGYDQEAIEERIRMMNEAARKQQGWGGGGGGGCGGGGCGGGHCH